MWPGLTSSTRGEGNRCDLIAPERWSIHRIFGGSIELIDSVGRETCRHWIVMVGQAITIVILSIKLLKDSRCATRRKKSNLPSYQSTCQTDKKQVSIVAEINNVRFLRQFLNKMGKVREERSVANRALAPVCKHILRFVVGSKQGINVHIAFLV